MVLGDSNRPGNESNVDHTDRHLAAAGQSGRETNTPAQIPVFMALSPDNNQKNERLSYL